MDIAPLIGGGAAAVTANPPAGTPAPATGSVFERLLDAVNDSAGAANEATTRMVDGTGDVHEAMIALQQADLALQFAVQIRNKLVQAYQEISRMPV